MQTFAKIFYTKTLIKKRSLVLVLKLFIIVEELGGFQDFWRTPSEVMPSAISNLLIINDLASV